MVSRPPRPVKIPIVVDTPHPAPGMDFDRYVNSLAGAIMGGTPARYTIGLYGAWGTGKSSILEALSTQLTATSDDVFVVRFDAWRYEKYDNIIFPLLYSVKKAVTTATGERSTAIRSALSGLLQNLEVSFMGVGLRVERGEQKPSESYTMPFSELQTLSTGIGADKRIVVLVDDLDRCSPDSVVDLIEAIHVLTDVEGFVFVLALDYAVLIRAIQHRYKNVDADQFIEKIVQVPFRIPALDGSADTLMQAVVPAWPEIRETWFNDLDEELVARVIDTTLRSNPRQVKRLVNSLLMTKHISWGSDTSDNLLVTLIALQMKWPDLFAVLHRRLVLAREDDRISLGQITWLAPFFGLTDEGESSGQSADDIVAGADDPEFGLFIGEFFGADSIIVSVLDGMKLTAATAQAEPAVEMKLTNFESRLALAPTEIVELVRELIEYTQSIGVDVTPRDNRTYLGFGRPKSFVSINFRPIKGIVLLYLPIPLRADDRARGYVDDAGDRGHHGNGAFEIVVKPGQTEQIAYAKSVIQRSYDALS
jgi:predicted transport protein